MGTQRGLWVNVDGTVHVGCGPRESRPGTREVVLQEVERPHGQWAGAREEEEDPWIV